MGTLRFRFNKQTGEVEEFVVELPQSDVPLSEHNRRHDDLAVELGQLLEQYPHIREVLPEEPAPDTTGQEPTTEPVEAATEAHQEPGAVSTEPT
jgi:hypothetical protein